MPNLFGKNAAGFCEAAGLDISVDTNRVPDPQRYRIVHYATLAAIMGVTKSSWFVVFQNDSVIKG
jgi:hypothetical protein